MSSHPRLSFFDKTPVANAVATKFVVDKSAGRVPIIDGVASPHPNTLSHVTSNTAQSIRDAENIFATQPDIEIAMSVLVSAIMSPIELRDANLTWVSEVPEIPADLNSAMLEYLRSYFEDEYKIKDIIEPMLKNCLFLTGSYPLLILPESSIDDIINNRETSTAAAVEHFKKSSLTSDGISKPLGILGNNNKSQQKKEISFEASMEQRFNLGYQPKVNIETNIGKLLHITDNPECLKLPLLMSKLASEKLNSTALRSKALESLANAAGTDVQKVMRSLKVERQYRGKTVQRVKSMANSSRQSIGHPLVVNLSSVSTIPVHLPADPQNPLGHFVLVDPLTGHEITEHSAREYTNSLSTYNNTAEAHSKMLERTGFLTNGTNNDNQIKQTADQLIMAFSKEFEREMAERFANGVYGQEVTFPRVTEFYRIMLTRTLANQHTQILYVPAELMTYFAFDYNEYGIGRSMLDKMKILANIRSVLLFGNVMGALKNSVPHRNVTIQLEESDPEPEKTVEMMMTEYAKVQSSSLSIDATAPRDMIDGIRRAATSIIVNGNSAYPEISMSVEDTNTSRASIETDLMDAVDTRMFQGFSLTPELVDSTKNIEFASVALNSNLLFTKRVAMIQATASPLLVDHIVKYTLNSGTLLTGLLNIIKDYQTKNKDLADDAESESNLTDLENMANTPAEAAPDDVEGEVPAIEPVEPADVYTVITADSIKGSTVNKAKEEGLAQTDSSVNDDWMNVITEFLNCLKVTLPAPDNTKLSSQIEQFNNYAQALDAVLPMYINEDILRSIIGPDNEESIASILEIIKGYFLRDYAARNNIMPELGDLVRKMVNDEKPFDLLEEHTQHIDGITQTLASLIGKFKEKNGGGEAEDDAGGDYGGGSDAAEPADVGDDEFGDFDTDFSVDGDADEGGTDKEPLDEPAEAEAEAEPAEELPATEVPEESDDVEVPPTTE